LNKPFNEKTKTTHFIACYFNSLLQIYYTIPAFVEAILCFKDEGEGESAMAATTDSAKKPKIVEESKAEGESAGIDKQVEKRLKASKKLIFEMKKLFASLTKSDKKYTDPSGVLHAIVDDFGNPIQIGEQKDIGEFNNNFLARIQEGLKADEILAKMRKDAED
jgi:ubiquitin carboxyl-terminal hydrolase 25/28